jgi:ankyrin repeat protein
MHLLQLKDNDEFSLVEYIGNNIPRYAILSHTWGPDNEEVTFQDLKNGTVKGKAGYHKIRFCGKRAARDNLQYFWVDSCCINKESSAELSEAINSMFRWYQNAEKCYVYLSDVSDSILDGDDDFSRRWKSAFKKSRWFTRGWTLQELIAPGSVEFFSREETCLGNKQSLEQTVHEITGIAIEALRGSPLSQFSNDERLSWAANRETKREEDEAYCLLGIFDISMSLLYGEGRTKAFIRLKKRIKKTSKDKTSKDETSKDKTSKDKTSKDKTSKDKTSKDKTSLASKQRQKLLNSLRFDQIEARHMTIKDAHNKTCKWLLESSEYLDWLNASKLGEHHGFLWIKGKPGAGKSTLMKFALANACKTIKACITISFFFNARGEDIEKSTIGTYRSLLLQLLERLPAPQCVFDSLNLPASSISTDYRWSVEVLKKLLKQVIQNLGESSVVCFIDALDECEEQQIRDMISFFEHVGELAVSTGIKFRVCFASRHYPYITMQKHLDLVLSGQGHDQDIADYLASELKIGHSNLAKKIRVEVHKRAAGIFMWVVLVVKILNKEYDAGHIYALQRRLQEIPSDLHELFRDILTRDSHNRDELALCIQWMLFAKQPLSPEQLYFAILSGVESDVALRCDPDEITRDVVERFILSSSKGLAEITTSNIQTVQFIHESVKDFLVKENMLTDIWPDLKGSFQVQSHERLKQICLTNIGHVVSADLDFSKNHSRTSEEAVAFRKSTIAAFPFLEYAVPNVLYHADVAGGGISQADFVQNFPLADWIDISNVLAIYKVPRPTEKVSLLYILAERNMSNLISDHHPSILSYLEVERGRYGPPLFAALATKSMEAVQTFLEAHTGDQSLGSWFHGFYNQHKQDNSSWYIFGPEFKFSRRRSVSSYLAELGNEAIFATALGSGQMEVVSKDKTGRTPLSWAAGGGHKAVVKMLLETAQVEVDSKDETGRTPLSWAAGSGYEAVVKLLLETGQVDVDSKDVTERTPLWRAAGIGQEAVVKLLLETGQVEVDSKDKYWGQTPLSWAASRGHKAVVKLLLETGQVEVNSKDKYWGHTPLFRAAGRGHEAVVKLLLDTGQADVNSKDIDEETPLSCAARNGHEALVKILESHVNLS